MRLKAFRNNSHDIEKELVIESETTYEYRPEVQIMTAESKDYEKENGGFSFS